MTKGRIVSIDTGYDSYDVERYLIEAHGYSFEVFDGEWDDIAGKMAFVEDAVGMLVRWTTIDDAFLAGVPTIRAMVRYGTGYDNFDLEAATRRGVKAANVQGYASHSVSDHAMGLMFAVLRDLPQGQQRVRENFLKPGRYDIFELHEKTLGIIGLGRIGSTFCHKACRLFKRVVAFDPYKDDEQFNRCGAEIVDLETLLSVSHVISIHCNLTEETYHLMDAAAFSMIRQRPILINTSRGPVVEQAALLKALAEDRLYGAGLDVYETEPPSTGQESLFRHEKVITTGHYAWYSRESVENLKRRVAHNLIGLLEGSPVEDWLNP